MKDVSPTGRFSDRADDYARFRPGYPSAAIDAILEGLGDPAMLSAADVGAGTGISARLLAARGVRVTAVEPNAPMREAAVPHPGLSWCDGTAERTGLASSSQDIVLAAQAFHWFRAEEALAEFARILRSGGRLVLMMNEGVEGDPATDAYYALVRPFARADAAVFANAGGPSAESLLRAGFDAPRQQVLPGGQTLDLSGLVGRARSASYVPREGPEWEAVARGLAEIHARHADPAGRVRIVYRTHVLIAKRG